MIHDPALPLAGLRVVDLTRNVAGPYASMILADLGADVIKIEQPGVGDDARSWGPPFWPSGVSTIFAALNRNKRSISLDIKSNEGRETLAKLVAGSDVLIQSLRPGRLEALGLGYAWAMALNSRLIYCSITAYGATGPRSDQLGYDPVIQAFAGLMAVTGEPTGPPVRVGTSIIDMGTGLWAANAILAALFRRECCGHGQRIETSLYETGIAWMTYHLASYWATGHAPRRHASGSPMIVPFGAYEARDGHLVVAAPTDALFARLCVALGCKSLLDDSRFRHNEDRVRNRVELDSVLAAVVAGFTAAQAVERLTELGVPAAPIRSVEEVAADDQAHALDLFQLMEHPSIRGYRSVGVPFFLDGRRPPLRLPPPNLGEHTDDVHRELHAREL